VPNAIRPNVKRKFFLEAILSPAKTYRTALFFKVLKEQN
jgi:hypothetical protein